LYCLRTIKHLFNIDEAKFVDWPLTKPRVRNLRFPLQFGWLQIASFGCAHVSEISFISPDARRVLVVVNPSAGARSGRAAVDQLVELLQADGFQADVLTEIDAAAEATASLLADGKLRAVVAAGGDGTAGLVVNRTPPGTPVAVLPLGTENLLSKHFEVPADPDGVFHVIQQGASARFDAGRVGDRLFLLMAGCGFDADVVRRLHEQRRGHIHHLSYVKPILDSIRNYPYPELRITCEGEQPIALTDGGKHTQPPHEPIVARWAFVMNLPRYAAGLQIAPRAEGDDGLLDLCTFKEGSLWSGLTYLAGVLMGQHQTYSDCVVRRARRVRIESDEPAPYQLDGDPGGFTPLEIDIVPRRLTLLVPQNWAKQHGLRSDCEASV
jgi:diacylglycerol kinase family enzyme